MTFKVRKAAVRKWPVTVTFLDGDDAGNVTEQRFTFVAHFKPLTEKQYKEVDAKVEAEFPLPKPLPPAEEGSMEVREAPAPPGNDYRQARHAFFFSLLLCGWGNEVTDEAGLPIPFSTEALTEIITGPDSDPIVMGLFIAYGQFRRGEAPAKNSPTSPVPGAAGSEVLASPATSSAALSPTT